MRPLALAMAKTHLRGDRDVILPQYLGRLGEIERFQTSARDSGAAFCEIVLMDTRQRSRQRFYGRDDDSDLRWHRYVQQVVERHGGPALLADMHDRLSAVLAARPDAIVLPSTAGAVEETYQALTAILHPPS